MTTDKVTRKQCIGKTVTRLVMEEPSETDKATWRLAVDETI